MWAYVEILLICNFHPSRARNYATTITSKLNNFAEVLAVRVHVNVYMATPALRSLMIILPEYDANWHQKCTFFPLTLEDKTTDLDTEIFVLVVGNPIHYGVQVEFWSNLTIFRFDDPSKIDKFAIF